MAPTTPDQIRRELQRITQALWAEVDAVALAYQAQREQRSALFSTTPLLVAEYQTAASSLALDWYEEIRDLASPSKVYIPQPFTSLRVDKLDNAITWATDPDLDTAQMLDRLRPVVQKDAIGGFWDSITGNVAEDPDAVGWQRFTRGPDACPFCRMLADKGAVYSAETANFAAHTTCHCVARPALGSGEFGPPASAMQYLASKKRRTARDRAVLRDYLKANYGA